MTRLYHRRPGEAGETDAEALLAAIAAFLSSCRRPAALEYGENAIPLPAGCYALEIRSDKLFIEIWDDKRSVSRRILDIEGRSTGILDCTVQKFGGKPGRLSFLDLDRPQTAHRSLSGVRQNFAGQFRRMLSRQFPGWEIASLSSALDLRRSFSATFPRARLVRGNRQISALACPQIEHETEFLTIALIWHRYSQTQQKAGMTTSLCLFLAEGAGGLTSQRLRWLTCEALNPRLFLFNAHGSAGEVDPRDLGNIETRVSPRYVRPELSRELEALLARLEQFEGVARCPELGGGVSVRCRGLEFARVEGGRVLLGIEAKETVIACHTESVVNFAAQLAGLPAAARQEFPERWLESAVRAHLPLLDANLLPSPVHGQVLAFAAGDRDSIDLLACSHFGRLAILELKAAEDIHLPMQALDYWMRVAWHAERNELDHLFPGTPLRKEAPRLLLVAPAMSFHPSNTAVLQYFAPQIDVERIGVNSEWRKGLRVVLRLKDAEVPMSHDASECGF